MPKSIPEITRDLEDVQERVTNLERMKSEEEVTQARRLGELKAAGQDVVKGAAANIAKLVDSAKIELKAVADASLQPVKEVATDMRKLLAINEGQSGTMQKMVSFLEDSASERQRRVIREEEVKRLAEERAEEAKELAAEQAAKEQKAQAVFNESKLALQAKRDFHLKLIAAAAGLIIAFGTLAAQCRGVVVTKPTSGIKAE